MLDLRMGTVASASDGGGDKALLIAGGGPAACSAALYAARYRIDHVVLEGYAPGGQLTLTDRIENYPGIGSIAGSDLAAAFRAQAVQAGSEILGHQVVAAAASTDGDGVEIRTDGGVFRASTLIIATGAAPSRLGVPGEDRFYGRGVSYCATCDAPFFRGRRVMVVGGGDSAVKEALYLATVASSVVLVHRRDELRAEPVLAEKLLALPNVSVLWKSKLVEISGADGVESVRVDTPEGQREVHVDGVFMYVGRKPATAPFEGLVELAADGSVATKEGVRTSLPFVFAAGDVTDNPLRQVVTAAASGAMAAAAVFEYLQSRPGRR